MNTVSILTPPTLTPTNSVVPTGGVMVPMHRLKISMMPKWMVFMPKAWQTGKKMGVKIRQAGVISIKVPTTSRKKCMRTRITYLLLEVARSGVLFSS